MPFSTYNDEIEALQLVIKHEVPPQQLVWYMGNQLQYKISHNKLTGVKSWSETDNDKRNY